jgi:hypothetical protein
MSVVFLNQMLHPAKAVEDLGKFGRGLTNQEHIVTVGDNADKTNRRQVCVFLLERIKVTTKLISHFTVQSRFWKSVQSYLKLKHVTKVRG